MKQVHSKWKEMIHHVTGSRCLWEDGDAESLQGFKVRPGKYLEGRSSKDY